MSRTLPALFVAIVRNWGEYMRDVHIIWDLPDDPDGNYVHILDGHDVTIDEVEEVLLDPESDDAISRSSGYPCVFGWTSPASTSSSCTSWYWTIRKHSTRSRRTLSRHRNPGLHS